jgi:DNA-binding beta-propeller fold protein YncE
MLVGATTNWQALVCDRNTNQVFPINLPLNQPPSAESPITSIDRPNDVAITPDATKAVVSAALSQGPNIFTLDLTTSPFSIIASQTLAAPVGSVAITPDGSTTYAIDQDGDITVLNTSNLSIIDTIPQSDFGAFFPTYIALSPNKAEGYITTEDTMVFVINTNTNTVTNSFDLHGTVAATLIAVTPNGSEVYVGDEASNQVFYITLSDGIVHPITGLTGALYTFGIAIAPDGTAAYAIQVTGPSNSVLTKIDTSTHTIVEEFTIPTALDSPVHLAITPDGKTACITDGGGESPGQFMAFIDTTTGSSSTLQLSTAGNSRLWGIAITPDQAPTARFTPTMSGATVTFDASASSSPIGSIATYAWDFGDGQTATTTSPTTSHTYSTSGTFTVTLTVTNTAGTSTELTFTGQTASNNGGPSAVTTQQIAVQSVGVASFKGKTRIYHKSKKIFLKTQWSKLLSSNPRKVVIYERNKKVSTMKASHRHHQLLRLHPHHLPHKVSKDYRHYLEHKYNIRVVDSSGHVSEPTYLHIVKH